MGSIAVTYNNLYLDIRQKLLGHGVSMASLEAREIVRFASGRDRAAILREPHLYVPDAVERHSYALTERRLRGEPIAYIIGEWSFDDLTLDISPDVLIPRADTERLSAAALPALLETGEGARVLDLCTGSGCVGLAWARRAPGCRVVLADVSPEALRIARQNIRKTDLTGRVACAQADALSPAPLSLGRFDVIVCNPPYIPTGELSGLDASVRDYEPLLALDGGEDGFRFFRAVASGWKHALKNGGRLFFECGAGQATRLYDLLSGEGYGELAVLRDTQGISRVVCGRLTVVN